MTRMTLLICSLILAFTPSAAEESAKTLASTLEVFVFPADGQAADQQSKDEVECYSWATSNTGSDPFDLQKQDEAVAAQAEQQVAQTAAATQGSGAKTAVKGAAAGALIGEVTGGDAGDSAAIGAAAGVVAGRRRGRAANQQAQEQAAQAEEASHQATAEQVDNFKKAFGVCLEAKDYMVKF
jgi:hypothetical protein